MNRISKSILVFMSALLLTLGAMPVNSVICSNANGSLALKLSSDHGNCSCEEEHKQKHKYHSNCDSEHCQPEVKLTHNHDCHDTLIPSSIKHFSNDFEVDTNQLTCNSSLSFKTNLECDTAELQRFKIPQANAPPSHLIHIKATILLI